MYDLLIEGGRILDGTGTPWYWADVAVREGRVVEVGSLQGAAAGRTIKAGGCFVCPGFVDMHTHSDLQALASPLRECKIRQGVTTEVIGQDGLGLAPIDSKTAAVLREQLVGWNGDPDLAWDWDSVASYLDRFDRQVAVNVAMLVPHGTVRLMVMGMDDRPPTAAEMQEMGRILEQSLREGAVGLSTGLTYAPAMYAADDELVELCKLLRPFQGFYSPHHRNYGSKALEAYRDSIEIGRKAGAPVHLTHCHLGYPVNKGRAPQLLAMVDEARADGVDVTLDNYPYLPGNTTLHSFMPSWMHVGGTEATLARLREPGNHARLQQDMEVTGSDGYNGIPMGWEMVQISAIAGAKFPELAGVYLPQAAAAKGQTSFDFFVELLIETRLGVTCLVHIGNEENVRPIMQHAAHMVGSDGILIGDSPHPRGWGAHVRFLARYVRDLGLLSWEEGVRHMTAAPARKIGCLDRGILRPGFAADLVVFDPVTLQDTASFENPRSYPEGVPYVAVNGELVVDEGKPTGARPGRALR